MWKILLYQVYTNLAYVPPTYRRVKKLQVLMCNENLCISLASRNGNEILIWSWNNRGARVAKLVSVFIILRFTVHAMI